MSALRFRQSSMIEDEVKQIVDDRSANDGLRYVPIWQHEKDARKQGIPLILKFMKEVAEGSGVRGESCPMSLRTQRLEKNLEAQTNDGLGSMTIDPCGGVDADTH